MLDKRLVVMRGEYVAQEVFGGVVRAKWIESWVKGQSALKYAHAQQLTTW